MDYKRVFTLPRLWLMLGVLVVGSFIVLLGVGSHLYQVAPPIPDKVVTDSGQVIFTKEDIQQGQDVWRTLGGMQLGSVWGHGGYE